MNHFQTSRLSCLTRPMVPYLLFWASLAGLLLLYAIRPISDPDFWWHLKTGDLILQQNRLLTFDPFNYSGDGTVQRFQAVTLRGYWLWQITASLLHSAFGFAGIFLLNIATAAFLMGAVLYGMCRQQLSPFTMAFLTGLGTLVVVNVYHLERPQIFSFIFATLLVGMIARIRLSQSPDPMIIPLMILWANTHPGFVIGDIILGIAAAGFLIQYRSDRSRQRRMTTWAVVGILASCINPSGWNVCISLFNFVRNPVESFDVVEYRSSLQFFLLQSKSTAVSLWALAALHLACLMLAARRFWPEILLSLFVIVISLAYIRNSGFLAVSLLPMTGWYMEQGYKRLRGKRFRYFTTTVCLLLGALLSWQAIHELLIRKSAHGSVSNSFPVNMADYLLRSGLSGRLFNEYNAGGYLDWALYPTWKTFIDGRNLDPRVAEQYLKTASGSLAPVDGKPYYQQMLDRYQVDVVALRTAFPDGRIQPLLKLLLNNPAWTPVFLDDQSFVLVRNTARNAAVIQRDGLDKIYFLDMLSLMIDNYRRNAPDAVHFSVMDADLLIYRGKRMESTTILEKLKSSNLSPQLMRYLEDQLRAP